MPDSSTILLVDDEDSVQKLLTYPLERDGFRVVQARDGEQALRMFGDERIDLVVLDLMLPKVDGLEVCKRLRADSNVPIIMLTARGEELDKVLGLELGADDYITKPFSIREFRSRVRALLRRAGTTRRDTPAQEPLEVEGLRIDPERRSVSHNGTPVDLTYVEFELLRTIAAQPGRARLSLALLLVVAGALALVYLVVVPSLQRKLVDSRETQVARVASQVRGQWQFNARSQFDPQHILAEPYASATNTRVTIFEFS